MRYLYRISLMGFGIYWINIKDCRKKGDKRVAQIGAFAPHQSLADGINIEGLDKSFTGVGALPELHRPLTGAFFQALEYVWVDYEIPESRSSCAKAILHRSTSAAWKDIQQIFQVEGTTHSGCCFTQFKKGAFLPGQPVQPIVLELPEWIDVLRGNLTKGRRRRRGAGWAGWCYDTPMWLVILYQITVFWQPATLYILPVYEPSEEEKSDAVLFAKNVRASMAKATGFEIQEMNQHDGWLVAHISSKYPKLNPQKYALYGEILEDKYGSRVLNKRFVREQFEEFMLLSKGKPEAKLEGVPGMQNFHTFMDLQISKQK